MSGFNKRSRLSPPSSAGKAGVPPKGKPQTPAQSSDPQKAPGKKLQWSMNDLLTKLDSGDAPASTVEEAMAQARAGEAVAPPPAPPAREFQAARTSEEPAFTPNEQSSVQPAESGNGNHVETHEAVAEPEAPPPQGTPEQFAVEQGFSAYISHPAAEPQFQATEAQYAAEQSFSAFTTPIPGNGQPEGDYEHNAEAIQQFRHNLDQQYDAAALAAQAQFDAFQTGSAVSPFEINAPAPAFEAPGYETQTDVQAQAEPAGYAEQAASNEESGYNEQAETSGYIDQDQAAGYAEQDQATGYAEQAESAGYAEQDQSAEYAEQPESAGYAEQDQSAEYAEQPESAGYAEQDQSAEYAEQPESAGYAEQDQSAEYAEQSGSTGYTEQDQSAEYAEQSGSTGYAEQDQSAGYAEQAELDGYSEQDQTAGYAEQDPSGGYEPSEPAGYGEPSQTYDYASNTQFEPEPAQASFDAAPAYDEASGEDADGMGWNEPGITDTVDAPEWMEPGVTAETPPLEWMEPTAAQLEPHVTDSAEMLTESAQPAPAETPSNQQELPAAMTKNEEQAAPATSLGAAAMLMKKAAQKKSEIFQHEPEPEPTGDSDEPYSFQRPELPAADRHTDNADQIDFAKQMSEKPFDPQYETGRFQFSEIPTPAVEQAQGMEPTAPASSAPASSASTPVPPKPAFDPRMFETGRIDMTELKSMMPPAMAAAFDKSATTFLPGEEPQLNATTVSPPSQFKRDQIPASDLAQAQSADSTQTKEKPEGTAPATKPKKKRATEGKSTSAGDAPPQSQVVKNIQKMAPLSSMRAAEHQELASESAKLEHKDLLTQTNQIKNRMRSVPVGGEESQLSRQAKIRFADSMDLVGKHQRHVIAIATAALLLAVATVFFNLHENGDMVKKVASKLENKQYADARDLVEKGLARFPNDANLHFFKGRLLAKQGQNEQALHEYMIATAADPNNLSFIDYRAKLYIDMRKFDEAIADYNRLLASPQFTKAYNYDNRAIAHVEKGSFDLALADANKAISLDAKKPDYHSTRAWAYYGMKNYPQAIKEWSVVIAKDPDDANAYAERARSESSNKQVTTALNDLAKSISIKPSGSAYFYRGLIYRDEKQPAVAISDFTKALKYDPNNPSYIQARAQVYAATGNFEQAVQGYDALAILQKTTESPELINARASAEMKAGKYSQAAADWEKVVALKPSDSAARLNHADCCLNNGEYTKAYDDYSNLIEKDPKNASLYVKRGWASAKGKHYDIGEADFEKAIGLSPNNPDSYLYRGMASAEQGLLDQASVDLNHALKLQPDNALAKQKYREIAKMRGPINTTGSIAAALPPPRAVSTGDPVSDGYRQFIAGNVSEAIDLFARGVKKNPNNAAARRYLAYALLQSGQTIDAVTQFRALASLGALTADDETKYADALVNSGNTRDASMILSKKLDAQPDNLHVRMQLARLFSDLGSKEKARQLVLDGMKESKSPADYAALKDLLTALQNGSDSKDKDREPQPPGKAPDMGG